MTKIPAFTALALFGCSPFLLAQDGGGSATVSVHTQQAEELMRGMTFIDGQFVATHTLDDSSSATASSTVLGYPDASHLPDSAPLLSAFNAFGFGPASIEAFLSQWLPQGFSSVEEWAADIPATLENLATWYQWSDPAFDYFNDLNSLEQASLYRALVEEADPAAGSLLNLLQYLYSEAEVVSQILTNLPAGEAAAALDSLRGNLGYLDLSGLNLTGWNPIGEALEGVSFAGSNVTAEQLNGAIWIGYTDLSGTGITRADLEALGRDSAELDTITF